MSELWPRYFAFGGLRSEDELGRYFDGKLEYLFLRLI